MKSSGRLIPPPPRSSFFGSGIIIGNAVLLSITPFLPGFRPWAALFAAILLVPARLLEQIQALHLSVLTVLVMAIPLLGRTFCKWPLVLLAPVVLYFALALSIPRLRSSLPWLRPGLIGRDIFLLVIGTAVVSGIALYVWYLCLRPDLSIHLASMPSSLWLFPLAGLAFSVGNAAVEEVIFRGVVMQALDSAFAAGAASVLVQGWLFGAMHFLRGFPNGAWGVAMAAVYGVMLGTIRRRSQGMIAPWLTHVCADVVIFMILAAVVLNR